MEYGLGRPSLGIPTPGVECKISVLRLFSSFEEGNPVPANASWRLPLRLNPYHIRDLTSFVFLSVELNPVKNQKDGEFERRKCGEF